jgi:hypothetical protein
MSRNINPCFQHRHYVEIAAIIASTHGHPIDVLISELADMFARDNERFDRSRFASACRGAPINGRDKFRRVA